MSAKKVGDTALSGEWEQVGAQYFDITEDMTMHFQGRSCTIQDSADGNLVEQLGAGQGSVTRQVLAGYRCTVLMAWVKFEKKSS